MEHDISSGQITMPNVVATGRSETRPSKTKGYFILATFVDMKIVDEAGDGLLGWTTNGPLFALTPSNEVLPEMHRSEAQVEAAIAAHAPPLEPDPDPEPEPAPAPAPASPSPSTNRIRPRS
jgi:hypothetical protein